MAALIVTIVFLTVVLMVYGVFTLLAQAPERQLRKTVGYRLDSMLRAQQRGSRDRSVELFKQELLGSLPALDRILLQLPRARALQRALQQANWRISVVTFVLLSAGLAGGLLFVGTLLLRNVLVAGAVAALAACLPYVVLSYRRKRRLDRFLSQFPDAIELLSRAVRAGHAITTGLDMVASEMDDPIGEEFRHVYDQQKFGLPTQQALLDLQERVPLMEVVILVTAVTIQREVGGNLAEVLDKIAYTIRERFKIRRQVQVFTAQGRLTGYILALLPMVLAGLLLVVNPDYFAILLEHEFGIFMIGAAALLQIAGYFWIRKIIHIKI